MPTAHRSTFTTSDWDERETGGLPGALRQTTVTYGVTFIGDVAGSGVVTSVMVYKPDGTVEYVGYAAFEGTIGARGGSTVFEVRGTYDGESASADLTVVPGTPTGELGELHLTGTMVAPRDGDGTLLLIEHDIAGGAGGGSW